ncbi:MAG TPA: STAS domain-containing protein [Candidatus Sumerlaeota bacterium]|nr:MAG: STAS domain protein [candidate division BRC1 bacterium ADurb.BinA292]HOE96306.1 STAS domain-containing protein [Candidatus Sumerlaeota bacterium]HOR27424.1 STAS domain-containing protein [Candidatus Sumerlaeota bacterium]HPK01831.1 STAS domain-containing protein [Candidatus Sumerlaeota bacterium]
MASPETQLTIAVQREADHVVIVPTGYLNALTGERIDKVCDALLKEGIKYILINFKQVELINTIGISILVGIIEKVHLQGGLVYFTHLGGTNLEIFEVLDLGSVALFFPTDDQAREHLRHDRETQRRALGQ